MLKSPNSTLKILILNVDLVLPWQQDCIQSRETDSHLYKTLSMPQQKHSIEEVKHNLELNEHLSLHKKGWVIQTIGWIIIITIMVAGALGVFGGGILSKQRPSSGYIETEFERFFRYESEMKILIESGEHISNISLPQQYISSFRIVRFEPQPINNNTSGSDVVFNFLPANNRLVTIYLVPKAYGNISGTMKVNGTNNIVLHHFIYP